MFEDLVGFLVKVLLIAGAVNWGLVAYSGTDLVTLVVGYGDINRIIKLIIGLAGVIAAVDLVRFTILKQ
jgi:uncharacterized membrane protein YuzA (DUF378 family)